MVEIQNTLYDAKSLADRAALINEFLHDTEYKPPSGHQSFSNKDLESAMVGEMDRLNIRCKQLEKTLHLCASIAELCYHNNTFEEKLYAALLTWYLVYIDDTSASKDPTPFAIFGQRFLKGQKQLDPILDALSGVLINMADYYDPLCFNLIVSGALQYITTTCFEPELEKVPVIDTIPRFPWFMREGTGLGQLFSLQAFPLSKGFKVLDILPAIPDMDVWFCFANDLLSFHKEELAGETNNYVHNRARVESKSASEILWNISDELRAARNIIHVVLSKKPEALQAWKTFEHGYIAWHMVQERYKLKDLVL